MSVTPILWIIIPVQVLLLIRVILLCVKILNNRINYERIREFITSPNFDEKVDGSSILGKIISIVRSNEARGKTINYEDLSDLIYNEITKTDSVIKALINSEVILGLTGTFFGLIIALSNISPGNISKDLSATDFINSLIGQMQPFLMGLSTAFYASFCGVLFMLIGNLFFSYSNNRREKNLNDTLFVISNELLPSLASAKPEERIYQSVDHFSEKVEMLTEKIRESLFDFNSRFELLIKKTTDSFNTTLDKILDENKIALNSQITNLQTSANSLVSIKDEMIKTTNSIITSNEKQFVEISNLHTRISEESDRTTEKIHVYVEAQSKIVSLFNGAGSIQEEMITKYSEHFEKLKNVGDNARDIIVNVANSLNGMIEKTNRLVSEHFDAISKEYDKRLLETITGFSNKAFEVFEKYDNNTIKLDSLINQTAENANKLEQTLYSNLEQISEGIKNNVDNLTSSFSENLSQLTLLNKQFPEFLNGMETNNSSIKEIVKGFDSIIEKFEENVKKDVAEYFITIEKATDEIEKQFKKLDTDYSSIVTEFRSFARAQTLSIETIDRFKESVDLILEPIKLFKNAADEVRLTFDNLAGDFLEKQKELFVKITNQDSTNINIAMSDQTIENFKDIIKQQVKVASSEVETIVKKPNKKSFIKKKNKDKEDQKAEIQHPLSVVKPAEIKEQNWFTKKVFGFFGFESIIQNDDTFLKKDTLEKKERNQ